MYPHYGARNTRAAATRIAVASPGGVCWGFVGILALVGETGPVCVLGRGEAVEFEVFFSLISPY